MTHKTYIVFLFAVAVLFFSPAQVSASDIKDQPVVGNSGMVLASETKKDEGIQIAAPKKEEQSIPSESLQRFPIEKQDFLGISQHFGVGHAGLDIRGKLYSQIFPIKNGKVLEVKFEKFGYGHHVLIQHEDGSKSLYAHMNEIFVKPGEEVSTVRPIGTLGLTGRTTGPHLHLEIMDGNKRLLNPLAMIKPTE